MPGKPGEQVNIIGPANSTGVAAIVNDFVISNYDLDQRTALFVATSGVRPTADNLPQIRAQVLRSLEDEVLELQEAKKHKITVNQDRSGQGAAEYRRRQQADRRSDPENHRSGRRNGRPRSASRSRRS